MLSAMTELIQLRRLRNAFTSGAREVPISACFTLSYVTYLGTGKTYCYRTIYHLARAKRLTVINMASTGIAATLLDQGKTVHKAFQLPVPMYEDSESKIEPTRCPAEIRDASVFIIDEAPMAQRYIFEAMDRLLRKVHGRRHPDLEDVPFGGAVVLCGGDFR